MYHFRNDYNYLDNTNSEEESGIWSFWRNSFGSLFNKDERKESRRFNKKEGKQRDEDVDAFNVATPIIDSFSRIASKAVVSIITNEVKNFLNPPDKEDINKNSDQTS